MKSNVERREYFRLQKRVQRAKSKAVDPAKVMGDRVEKVLSVHPHLIERFENLMSRINVELRAERARTSTEDRLRVERETNNAINL